MWVSRWTTIVLAFTMVSVSRPGASSAAPDAQAPPTAGNNLAAPSAKPDPCRLPAVTSNPTRPNWDTSASTTQCGAVEVDGGWLDQPMGGGVSQTMILSSLRYGLTPKLDLRWGLMNYIAQGGGGTAPLKGAGDQWLAARYRFVEQSGKLPALAFIYGIKIPTASPAKGFGTGLTDHQFTLGVFT